VVRVVVSGLVSVLVSVVGEVEVEEEEVEDTSVLGWCSAATIQRIALGDRDTNTVPHRR
jgi:hypothetical protein